MNKNMDVEGVVEELMRLRDPGLTEEIERLTTEEVWKVYEYSRITNFVDEFDNCLAGHDDACDCYCKEVAMGRVYQAAADVWWDRPDRYGK